MKKKHHRGLICSQFIVLLIMFIMTGCCGSNCFPAIADNPPPPAAQKGPALPSAPGPGPSETPVGIGDVEPSAPVTPNSAPSGAQTSPQKPSAPKPSPTNSSQRNVAYFTQWGIYVRNYNVKDVDTSGAASKLTAINYAFAGITPDSKCKSIDPWADYQKHFTDTVSGQADSWNDANALAGNFQQLKELKAKYPNLKVLISIGGWTLSGQFSTAVQPANLQGFVQSCIDMFIKGNIPGLAPGAAAGVFDGIDIDWEYPAIARTDGQSPGYTSSPDDTKNFTAMLSEFRKQLGNNHLLSIAAPAGQDKYSKLELGNIAQYLDWINLMTYDYHGGWETTTNIQAPLFCNPKDPSPPPANTYCIDTSVQGYLQAGVPANKMNLGFPFYGHGWTNVANTNNGLYQANVSAAPGQYEAGTNDFKVLEQLKSQGYTEHRDSTTKGYWLFNGTTMWSFDDGQEIKDKMDYAKKQGLGGAFCWSLDGDDPQLTLLNAMTG